MARKALFLALDNSTSMDGAKVAALRTAMRTVLSKFTEFVSDSRNVLDLGICVWGAGADTTTAFFYNATKADLDQAILSLDRLDASSPDTDFSAFTTDANAFFATTVPGDYETRALVFLTDGDPNPVGTDDTAATAIDDLLDRDSGVFSTFAGTAVDCYAANIEDGGTSHTAKLDNTDQDGVPVVPAADAGSLTAFLSAVLLPVSQTRLWGFPINWGVGFEEELAFRTEIITSRDGTEQRIAQRVNPRVTFSFESNVHNTRLREAIRRAAQKQGGLFTVPYPRESALVATAVTEGDLTVDLGTSAPDWVRPGYQLVLEAPDGRAAMTSILDNANPVVVANPIPGDFPVGTRVRWGVQGRFDGATVIDMITSRTAVATIEFDADPIDYPHPTVGAAADTMEGDELFLLAPNWAQAVELSFEQAKEVLDLNRGAVDDVFPVDFTLRTTGMTFAIMNDSDFDAIIGLFYRCRGRQKRFFMPTWADELRPLSGALATAEVLFFEGSEMYEVFSDSVSHRRVMVKMTDGTTTYLTFIDAQLDTDGDSVFELSEPLASDLPLDEIAAMYWVLPVRMASDRLTISWLTTGVAEVSLSVTTLEESP